MLILHAAEHAELYLCLGRRRRAAVAWKRVHGLVQRLFGGGAQPVFFAEVARFFFHYMGIERERGEGGQGVIISG